MVNEIILDRQTHILISDTIMGTSVGLYPSNDIYPSDSVDILYPTDATFIESNIVEGSMTLDEVIADGDIDLGKLYSTKFECDLYNVTGTLQGKFIQVYQTSDEYSYNIPIFLGYIDSCTSNRLGTDWHLIAYDLAYYYGGINIADKWNTYMSTTSVITTTYGDFPKITNTYEPPTPVHKVEINWCTFLKMILDDLHIVHNFNFDLSLGVTCVTDRDNVELFVNKTVQKMTLSDLISSICQLAKVIPHFGKDGVFRVIELDTSDVEHALDLTDNYEKENLNVTQLIHPPFDNIEYKYTNYRLKTTTTETLNSNANKYSITNNIVLLTAGGLKGTCSIDNGTYVVSYNYTSLIQDVCTYLQSLQYYVGSFPLIVSDVNDRLGQLVKVVTTDINNNSETLYFPILKSTYSGTQLINQAVEASGTVPSVADTQQVDYSNENTQTQVEQVQTQVSEVSNKVEYLGNTHWENVADNVQVNHDTDVNVGSFTLDKGAYIVDIAGAFSHTGTTDGSGYRLMYLSEGSSSTAMGYIYIDRRTPISASGQETMMRISCTIAPTQSTTYNVYMRQVNGQSISLTGNVRMQYLRIK